MLTNLWHIVSKAESKQRIRGRETVQVVCGKRIISKTKTTTYPQKRNQSHTHRLQYEETNRY